jgi:biopolymer transport protein ExbD
MHISKKLILTLICTFLAAGSLFAQAQQQPQMPPQQQNLPTSSDVSDEELTNLGDAAEALEPIQIETQEKVRSAVEEEDLSFERFQQMMMAMQNPQMAQQVNITAEEKSKIQTLQPALMEIQTEARQKMSTTIQENGLTMQRYQQIILGAQQDPELMTRVEEELGLPQQQGNQQ